MTTCKICQRPKSRMRNGTSPNGTRIYWIDNLGNAWMGKKCPDCARKINRDRMKEKRKNDE